MPFESEADRQAMMDGWDAAEYAGNPIPCILNNAFVEVAGVEGNHPVASCSVADVPGVAHGSSITVNNVDYTVQGIMPDGTGMVDLILESA